MYEQSLSLAPDSVETAGTWARDIAQTELPAIAEQAEILARYLVSRAVQRAQPGEWITARIVISDLGLFLEVRDPAAPREFCGFELSEVSSLTCSFGSSS